VRRQGCLSSPAATRRLPKRPDIMPSPASFISRPVIVKQDPENRSAIAASAREEP
jgi:hypothetical protein